MESAQGRIIPSKRRTIVRSVLALGLALACVSAVKREDFKTCSQSGFCTRNRAYADIAKENPQWASPFQLNPSSLRLSNGVLTGDLINVQEDKQPSDKPALAFELHLLDTDAARVRINERNPIQPRYDGVQDTVLIKPYGHATEGSYQKLSKDENGVLTIQYGAKNQNTVRISSAPFKIEFLVNGVPTVLLNDEGLLRFERLRNKEEPKVEEEGEEEGEKQEEEASSDPLVEQNAGGNDIEIAIEKSELEKKLEENLWEERFKEFTDSKPRGPESFGMDITFSGINHVYGIPEHASSLSLKATRGPDAPYTEPYRLYNLDVFEYEGDNPMALYGSVPFMLGHSKNSTAAVFWMNAAETWIDVEKSPEDKNGGILSWIKSKKAVHPAATKTHWISEAGVLDLFVFLGPTHRDIFRQYASLVGTTALPQAFSIAYHQCRWNYNNQKDVAEVDAGFDEHDIPYDVLWLDIEHTNGKRYFTWDEAKFPNPTEMQESLSSKGRKMVTIIDPHIKKDGDYYVSKEGADLDVYIKNKDASSDFDGWCWPGSSQWIDFYNPKARDWWASQFSYDKYIGSTRSLFTWNDMNEPSVFSGPEITIPKDVIHYGNVEHRNVHNLYGTMFHSATAQGLTHRNETNQRPFVLSRAFFAGTQRFGAIWTGDNVASWEHLELASPMLLTIGLSGIPFSGADVGGFFGNPDAELLTRWYQAGIYYPFFRAHAHLDSKRREPWLFGEPYTTQIREAIRTRYTLLPFWYTLFQEASVEGTPIIRPMFTEFPEDEAVFGMDDQYMVGDAILVKPVVKSAVVRSNVYFAGKEKWFDIKDYSVEQGPGFKDIDSPADKIPVYQRAGTIVPKRERPRRSSKAMENDPFTLVIALDSKSEASGRLYLDDGESFNYEKGDYILREFKVSKGVLSSRKVESAVPAASGESSFAEKAGGLRIERIVILGATTPLTKVTVGDRTVQVNCAQVGGSYVCTVKEPQVAVGKDFDLSFA
ncbi:glycosyl hydrolases family 31-domain-containing protein [Linnemannia elongata]|nr:glycosyl hydrolases family 31-domain-containing protein [Linnemannia elongata]